jgi:exosortase/archaeosortase family protein
MGVVADGVRRIGLVPFAAAAPIDGGGVMHPLLVFALVATATWDAWRWYFGRVSAAPEEAAALVLTVAFIGLAGLARAARPASSSTLPLLPIAAVLALFAATYTVLPAIVRAAIAIALSLFCLYVAMFKERPPIAFWGLVALALPVLPSLHFILGYPMRVISAALTAGLLQAHGLAVERQGTFLVWRDELIQFDAPCSGVNILWAGLLLTLMGCVLLRLGALRVMEAVAFSLVLALASNVLRAASLFYVEAGLIPQAQHWWHDGIGIVAFGLSAVAILWILTRLHRGEAIH